MNETCTDNRFEVIAAYKKKLKERTNIETSPDEMAVIDHVLFRFWQMGWLPPVPHGRLGDLDKLYKKMEHYSDNEGATGYQDDTLICRDSVLFAIEDAPTIIPADRREREV